MVVTTPHRGCHNGEEAYSTVTPAFSLGIRRGSTGGSSCNFFLSFAGFTGGSGFICTFGFLCVVTLWLNFWVLFTCGGSFLNILTGFSGGLGFIIFAGLSGIFL